MQNLPSRIVHRDLLQVVLCIPSAFNITESFKDFTLAIDGFFPG